jgi:hypothetical protein
MKRNVINRVVVYQLPNVFYSGRGCAMKAMAAWIKMVSK